MWFYELIKDRYLLIATTYFLGAFLAILSTLALIYLAKGLLLRLPRPLLFATIFLSLAVATIAYTSIIFALDYRSFYAQWHAPLFSKTWFIQQVFTLAGALYQFAVLGLRLFFPLSPFIVLLTTIILFRRMR